MAYIKSFSSLVSGFAVAAALFVSPVFTTSGAYAADKTGSFRSTGRYRVSGKVTVTKSGKITLSGFRTSSGPDLHVYVGRGSASRRIAKLKRNSGTQTYSIPASLVGSISTVHIYCKRFSSNFGTARLR